MYKSEWRKEDEKRALDLERWYVLDGRHLKTLADGSDNPLHGVYTGLAAKGKELDGQLR
tara:strand:- start:297 stop:473 length:177 start_codon:yes stop_codon:yes gene_type:complete